MYSEIDSLARMNRPGGTRGSGTFTERGLLKIGESI